MTGYAYQRSPRPGAGTGSYVDPRGYRLETWPGRAEGGRSGPQDRRPTHALRGVGGSGPVLPGPGSGSGRKGDMGRGPADRTWYRRQVMYVAASLLAGAAILVA